MFEPISGDSFASGGGGGVCSWYLGSESVPNMGSQRSKEQTESGEGHLVRSITEVCCPSQIDSMRSPEDWMARASCSRLIAMTRIKSAMEGGCLRE